MDNLIVFVILAASLYYTGRRVYKQVFKGGGCSSCDYSVGDKGCSCNTDIDER